MSAPMPATVAPATDPHRYNYALTGPNNAAAVERGLANAAWYTCPVPKEQMRALLQRRDWPAIRDTVLWFALLIGSGIAGWWLWQAGSWWAVVPFLIYGVIYGSTSDSRWHESSHGTAFKTDWMNNVLYEIASFMVMRESTVWRWSHARHHSDTIVVGRDPEIVFPRPSNNLAILLGFFGIQSTPAYFRSLFRHACGRFTGAERDFVPASQHRRVIITAWVHLAIYAGVIATAFALGSLLPLMFIGLPNLYGAWLMPVYGITQHAGLAENVLDHRLNCRTVYMNPLHRYLYWNMNYHVEHHMFPLVPYHALPQLHALVQDDCPPAYRSIADAYREIIPALIRQAKDATFFVRRPLPPAKDRLVEAVAIHTTAKPTTADGWIDVGPTSLLRSEDVIRFDHDQRTYAIYRTADDRWHATEGICTHGNSHLAEGLVKGKIIECAKHNGRFDLTTGQPNRQPVCVALKTFPVRIQEGRIQLNPASGQDPLVKTWSFRVVSNELVATFIRELVLEPVGAMPIYQPGDYLQFDIPAYGALRLGELATRPPFETAWKALAQTTAINRLRVRRNYSIASNPASDRQLRFNIRIATPPKGQAVPAGAGSSYMHRLKPGDTVTAIGPFGTFHVKQTQREMVYLGGGAGMAPLRSHLAHLFETLKTGRRVSYWYGARSLQEVFYRDYLDGLAQQFPNFTFHLALSEPKPEDHWTGPTGFIHEVLQREHLAKHPDPTAIEYYLCGPPLMVRAATELLWKLGVEPADIAFDEF